MPLLFLLPFLFDLLTIGIICLDIYLFSEWYDYRYTVKDEYARYCLYGAIALALFSIGGKIPMKYFLSKKSPHADDPKSERSSKHEMLKRPDGSEINIEIMGNPHGQPILFIHGWMVNSTEWYYQKKYFSKEHQLILIDLPGLGKSKRPANRDFSLQKFASDLDAVIKHLKLKDVVLWGHSIGGMTILTYLTEINKEHARNVKAIILEHTTFTNPILTGVASGFFKAIEKPVIYPICYLMIALSPLFWINKFISYINGNSHLSTRLTSFTGTQTPGQLDFMTWLSTISSPAVVARGVLGMLKTYDVTNKLNLIKVPSLILAANKDRLTKPVASEFMHRNISGSELVILTPGGHQGLVERNEEANKAAQRFMDSQHASAA